MLIPQSDLSQWRASCNGEHTRLPFATIARLFGNASSASSPACGAGAAAAGASSSTGSAAASPVQQQTSSHHPSNNNNNHSAAGGNSRSSLPKSLSTNSIVSDQQQHSPLPAQQQQQQQQQQHQIPFFGKSGHHRGALVSQGEYCFVAVVPQRANNASSTNASSNFGAGPQDGSNFHHHHQHQPQQQLPPPQSAIVIWSRDGSVVTRCTGGHDESEGLILELSAVETVGRHYSLFATSTASSIILWLVRPLARRPPMPGQIQQQQQQQQQQQLMHLSSSSSSSSHYAAHFGGRITPPVAAAPPTAAAVSQGNSGRATPANVPAPNTAASSQSSPSAGSVVPFVLYDVAHACLCVKTSDLIGHQSLQQQYHQHYYNQHMQSQHQAIASVMSTISSGPAATTSTLMMRTPTLFVPEPTAMVHGGFFVTVDVLFFSDVVATTVTDNNSSPCSSPGVGKGKNASSQPPAGHEYLVTDDDVTGPQPREHEENNRNGFYPSTTTTAPAQIPRHSTDGSDINNSNNTPASSNNMNNNFGSSSSSSGSVAAAAAAAAASTRATTTSSVVVSRSVCRAGVGLALPSVDDPPSVQFEKPLEVLQEDRLAVSQVMRSATTSEGSEQAALPLMAALPPLFAFTVAKDRIVTAPPDSCRTTPSWNPCEDDPEAPLLSLAWLHTPSFVVYGAAASGSASTSDPSSMHVTPSASGAGAGTGHNGNSNSNSGGGGAVVTGVSQYKKLVCATSTRVIICRVAAGGQPEKLQKLVNGADGVFFRRISCSFEGKIWMEYVAPVNVRLWKQQQQERRLRIQQERAASDNETPFGRGCIGLGGDDDEDGMAATASAVAASVIAAASPALYGASMTSTSTVISPQQQQILQTMQQQFVYEVTCIVVPIHTASDSTNSGSNNGTSGGGGGFFAKSGFGAGREFASTALRISERPVRLSHSNDNAVSIFQQKFSPTHVGPQLLLFDAVRRRLGVSSLQSCAEVTVALPTATVVPRYMKFASASSSGGGHHHHNHHHQSDSPAFGATPSSLSGCSPPFSSGTAAVAPNGVPPPTNKQKYKFGPFAPVPVAGASAGKSAFGVAATAGASPSATSFVAPSKPAAGGGSGGAGGGWKFGAAAPPSSSSGGSSNSSTPVPFGAASTASRTLHAAASAASTHAVMTVPPTADLLFGSDIPIRTDPEADTARFGGNKMMNAAASTSEEEREASRRDAAREILDLLRQQGLLVEDMATKVTGGEDAVVRGIVAVIRRTVKQ